MTIKAPEQNNARFVSQPHCRFFAGSGLALPPYPRQHGKGDVFLTSVVKER
jgi:hypothetical protein